jgi:phage baseplate assembly protein W
MSTRADRFTSQNIKTQIYSDFLTNLNTHPVSGDVVRFVNEQAVIRSIKNLLLTDKGERLYQPRIGSNIRKLLFEPMCVAAATEIQSLVRETIEQHEPRAKILQVNAIPQYDANRYVVNIVILVINKQEPVNFNVTLTRVR